MIDRLFGIVKNAEDEKPEDVTLKTPVVPPDADLLAELAKSPSPYAEVINGAELKNIDPQVTLDYATYETLAEVMETVGQKNITGAPGYMRKWLCSLAAVSDERVEFYRHYRRLREEEPTFPKGIERWLKKNIFRLEDPAIPYDDRDGWRVFDVDAGVLDEVCPRVGCEKNGRTTETELVYIFMGIKNTSLSI